MKAIFVRVLFGLLIVMALSVVAPVALAASGLQAAPPITLTPEQLVAIVGAGLSLIFAYFPWVKDWYDSVGGENNRKVKAFLMLVFLIIASVAVFAGSCGQVFNVGITCDRNGAFSLLTILLAALMANQGTYWVAVRPYKSD